MGAHGLWPARHGSELSYLLRPVSVHPRPPRMRPEVRDLLTVSDTRNLSLATNVSFESVDILGPAGASLLELNSFSNIERDAVLPIVSFPGRLFAQCPFCDPDCYDHAIEWLLRGREFFAPEYPRVT